MRLNPRVHLQAIQQAVDLGVTHLFVQSAQPDQVGVIDYYGREALPREQARNRPCLPAVCCHTGTDAGGIVRRQAVPFAC